MEILNLFVDSRNVYYIIFDDPRPCSAAPVAPRYLELGAEE